MKIFINKIIDKQKNYSELIEYIGRKGELVTRHIDDNRVDIFFEIPYYKGDLLIIVDIDIYKEDKNNVYIEANNIGYHLKKINN